MTYDRELIASMLDAAVRGNSGYRKESMTEQAELLRTAASGVGDPGAEARDAWPARFGCNGPEGSFWTDDSALANKLIASTYDRDEWTVTDTQEQEAALRAREANNG